MPSGVYKRSEEHRENISGEGNPMYGKNHSEETKKKISKANKGHSINKGIPRSLETRIKISEAHKGINNGNKS